MAHLLNKLANVVGADEQFTSKVSPINLDDSNQAISIKEEVYIPLAYARSKMKKVLEDWTAMKYEYMKSLKDLDEHYKNIEQGNIEKMKKFADEYTLKYNQLKGRHTKLKQDYQEKLKQSQQTAEQRIEKKVQKHKAILQNKEVEIEQLKNEVRQLATPPKQEEKEEPEEEEELEVIPLARSSVTETFDPLAVAQANEKIEELQRQVTEKEEEIERYKQDIQNLKSVREMDSKEPTNEQDDRSEVVLEQSQRIKDLEEQLKHSSVIHEKILSEKIDEIESLKRTRSEPTQNIELNSADQPSEFNDKHKELESKIMQLKIQLNSEKQRHTEEVSAKNEEIEQLKISIEQYSHRISENNSSEHNTHLGDTDEEKERMKQKIEELEKLVAQESKTFVTEAALISISDKAQIVAESIDNDEQIESVKREFSHKISELEEQISDKEKQIEEIRQQLSITTHQLEVSAKDSEAKSREIDAMKKKFKETTENTPNEIEKNELETDQVEPDTLKQESSDSIIDIPTNEEVEILRKQIADLKKQHSEELENLLKTSKEPETVSDAHQIEETNKRIADITCELETKTKEIDTMKKVLEDRNSQLDVQVAESEEKRKELDSVRKDLGGKIIALESQISEQDKQIESIKQELSNMSKDLDGKKKEAEDKTQELDTIKKRLEDKTKELQDMKKFQQEHSNLKTESQNYVQQLQDEHSKTVDGLNEKIHELERQLTSETHKLTQEIEAKTREIEASGKELEAKKTEFDIMSKQLEALKKQLEERSKEVQDLKKSHQEHSTLQKESQSQVQKLQDDHNNALASLNEKIAGLEKQAAVEAQNYSQDLEKKNSEIEEKSSELERCKKDIDALNANISSLKQQIEETDKAAKESGETSQKQLAMLKKKASQEISKVKKESEEAVLKLKETHTVEVEAMKAEITALTLKLTEIDKQAQILSEKNKEIDGYKKQIAETNKALSDAQTLLQKQDSVIKKKEADAEELKNTIEILTKEKVNLEQSMKESEDEKQKLRKKMSKMTKEQEDSRKIVQEAQEEMKKLAESNTKTQEELNGLKTVLDTTTADLEHERKKFADMEKDYKESEEIRRKLHNKIEDAKGKIRVYARARPLSKSERGNNNETAVAVTDNETMRIIPKKKDFVFSRVFGEDSTQAEVFKETADLIQSALDGFNVCIFAYGQTGSGKTFTIAGGDTPELEGLVPRSMKHMFHLFKKQEKMFSFEVECYMLELYLDDLYDLFSKGTRKDLKIKKDQNGNVVVVGIETKKASSMEELYQIYNEGCTNRHTRKTKMNEASSRSHLVFSILISGVNKQTGEKSMGKLTLVDLAGSESRKKTQTDEMGNKEALSINGSLLCLGDVIAALSEKKKYVPYRNSPLTMLLSDSLGGVAKTLMIVCVSPADYNVDETITSLTYATRVRTITNNLKAQIDSVEVQKLKRQLDKLRTALKTGAPVDVIAEEFQDITDETSEATEPATEQIDEESTDTGTPNTPTKPAALNTRQERSNSTNTRSKGTTRRK